MELVLDPYLVYESPFCTFLSAWLFMIMKSWCRNDLWSSFWILFRSTSYHPGFYRYTLYIRSTSYHPGFCRYALNAAQLIKLFTMAICMHFCEFETFNYLPLILYIFFPIVFFCRRNCYFCPSYTLYSFMSN